MLPNDPQDTPAKNLDLLNAQPIWLVTNNHDGICRCNNCRKKTLILMLQAAFDKPILYQIKKAEEKFGKHAAAHVKHDVMRRSQGLCDAYRKN